MKNIIFILSLISIISCKKEQNQAAQNVSSSDSLAVKTDSIQTKNDTIKSVDDIKKEYAEVNALLTSKKLGSTGFKYICEEGGREGEVFFYYQDKKLKAVKNFYSEYSHFSSVTEYYIDKENVYFIFKQDTSWNFDTEAPKKSEDVSETKDDITERRIYLLNNGPVQCLEKKYIIRSVENNQDPGTIPNKEIKCSVDELMKTYQSILKNKDKKGEINQCL